MPPGSGRRRSPPAATPVAIGANAIRLPPPAPPRPPPAPSAAANRATTKGHAAPAVVLPPPPLTPLSHGHIHQRSCEFAVSQLVGRLTMRNRPPPPRPHGGWRIRGPGRTPDRKPSADRRG